jgi:dihydrofolate reductase
MSLDGFIAGPEGETDWIVIDPDIDFSAMFRQFDTVLLGRKTWEASRQPSGGGGMAGFGTIVFSRTLSPADCPGAAVSNDPEATLKSLKSQAGKDIWLFGGGSLFRSLLQLGLVDSVEVALVPVLLGSGLPLLPGPAATVGLRLEKHTVYEKTGTVMLEYSVDGERSGQTRPRCAEDYRH